MGVLRTPKHLSNLTDGYDYDLASGRICVLDSWGQWFPL